MATTSTTYAAHRAAGLCGFCPRPSPTSRCGRCAQIQNRSAVPAWHAKYKTEMLQAPYISDRRQGSVTANMRSWRTQSTSRALGWALVQHRERWSV